MAHFLFTAGAVLTLAVACVACDKVKPPATPLPTLQNPPVAADKGDQKEDERKVFAQSAQKEIDELKVALTELRAKVAAANAQTKAKLNEEMEKLEADLRATQERLTALKSATVESWTQLKESFAKSLDTLKTGVEKFRKNVT